MHKGEHDLLDVLKFELGFLETGGYRRSLCAPWRAPLIFEDSPTCARYYREKKPQPCGECLLMQFVPNELREKKIACRYIQLNAEGDTLDSLYHWAYEPEIETAIRRWLFLTIQRLENRVPLDGSPLKRIEIQASFARGCDLPGTVLRGLHHPALE